MSLNSIPHVPSSPNFPRLACHELQKRLIADVLEVSNSLRASHLSGKFVWLSQCNTKLPNHPRALVLITCCLQVRLDYREAFKEVYQPAGYCVCKPGLPMQGWLFLTHKVTPNYAQWTQLQVLI